VKPRYSGEEPLLSLVTDQSKKPALFSESVMIVGAVSVVNNHENPYSESRDTEGNYVVFLLKPLNCWPTKSKLLTSLRIFVMYHIPILINFPPREDHDILDIPLTGLL
jgi:hypothetical protein